MGGIKIVKFKKTESRIEATRQEEIGELFDNALGN